VLSSFNPWLVFHGLKRNLGNLFQSVCKLFRITTSHQPPDNAAQDLDLIVKNFFDQFQRWLEDLQIRYLSAGRKGKARLAKNLIQRIGDEKFSYSLYRIKLAVFLETLAFGSNTRSEEALFKLANFFNCFARDMVLDTREELITFFSLFRLLLDFCSAKAVLLKVAAGLFFLSKQFDLEPFIEDFLGDKLRELQDLEKRILEDADRDLKRRIDYLRRLFPFFSGGRPEPLDESYGVKQDIMPEGQGSPADQTPRNPNFFNLSINSSAGQPQGGFFLDNLNDIKDKALRRPPLNKDLFNQEPSLDFSQDEDETQITTFADFRKLLWEVISTRGSSEPIEFQINMLQVWRQFKSLLRLLGADRVLKGGQAYVSEEAILFHNLVVMINDVLTLLSQRSDSQEGSVSTLSQSRNFEDAAVCLTSDIFEIFVRISFEAQKRGLVSGFLLLIDLTRIAYEKVGCGSLEFLNIIERVVTETSFI